MTNSIKGKGLIDTVQGKRKQKQKQKQKRKQKRKKAKAGQSSAPTKAATASVQQKRQRTETCEVSNDRSCLIWTAKEGDVTEVLRLVKLGAQEKEE